MSKIICPISGVELIRAPYMMGLSLQETHPIFRVKRRDLITADLVWNFNKSRSTEEKRLIFLGVCHATDLFTWKVIPSPSLRTIEMNFIPAFRTAGWVDFAAWQVSKEIPMPRIIISQENQNMENVGPFFESIEDIRNTVLNKTAERQKSKEVLEKLFKEAADAFKKDRFFTPYIVDFVLEFTGLDKHPKAELFKRILLTKESEAWGLDRDVLLDLHDFLENEFDSNHPFYAPFFGQLNQLVAAQKTGFKILDLPETVESFVDLDEGADKVEISKAYQEKMIQTYGSDAKPEKESFATIGQWIQAMARWKLSQLNKTNKPDTEADV
jgi:hypothetical protein